MWEMRKWGSKWEHIYLKDELKKRIPSGRIPEIFSKKFYWFLLGFSVRIIRKKQCKIVKKNGKIIRSQFKMPIEYRTHSLIFSLSFFVGSWVSTPTWLSLSNSLLLSLDSWIWTHLSLCPSFFLSLFVLRFGGFLGLNSNVAVV